MSYAPSSSSEWVGPTLARPPSSGTGGPVAVQQPSTQPHPSTWNFSSSLTSSEFHSGWDNMDKNDGQGSSYAGSSDRSSFSSGSSSSGVVHLDIQGYAPTQYGFSSNYFESGTAGAPAGSIFGSNVISLKAPTDHQPVLAFSSAPSLAGPPPQSSTPSSSSASASASTSSEGGPPKPPLSRYAQLVQAKLRNTAAAAAAASEAAKTSSGSSASTSSASSKVGTPLAVAYPYQSPTAWPVASGSVAKQMHLDVVQGQTVCNPNFIGYKSSEYDTSGVAQAGGPGVIRGQMGPGYEERDHPHAGPSSSSSSSTPLYMAEEAASTVVPSPTTSSASLRRKEKRKRQSADHADEDGLWGQRPKSPPPLPSVEYNPRTDHHPSLSQLPMQLPVTGPVSSAQAPTSDWLPPSASPAADTYRSLSASAESQTVDPATFYPSAYQAGTGYGALPPPVVGSYPTGSDAPWWTRIDLGQTSIPQVHASYVYSSQPQQPSDQLHQQHAQAASLYPVRQEEPMPDYSFLSATDIRQQDARLATARQTTPANTGMTRYQQLLAAKYSSTPVTHPAPVPPSVPVSVPVEPQALAPTTSSSSLLQACPSQSSTLSAHVLGASPSDYSQYPMATPSALFAPDLRPANNYSQPSSTSSALFPKKPATDANTSARFPSYLPPSDPKSYTVSYEAYESALAVNPNAAGTGGLWASALYDGTVRADAPLAGDWNSNTPDSSASSSSAGQLSVYPATGLASMSPFPASIAHGLLPPTPILGTSHLVAQPPTPSPGSQSSQLPMSSLLLPSYANPYAPPPTRGPQPSLASFASSPVPGHLPLSSISQTGPTPPISINRPLSCILPNDPRHPAFPTTASIQAAMPPPPLPIIRPQPQTFSQDNWNHPATPLSDVGDAKGKGRAVPRPKKVKGEPKDPNVPPSFPPRDGSSEGSSSAPSTEDVPMTVTEKDGKRKLMLACHFCRGRKLKCDGNRIQCAHCVYRGTPCTYDTEVRRRGPGRKKIRIGGGGGEGGSDADGETAGMAMEMSTASKPTKMKGVGSGHGQKMGKQTKKERRGGAGGGGGGPEQDERDRLEMGMGLGQELEIGGWRG